MDRADNFQIEGAEFKYWRAMFTGVPVSLLCGVVAVSAKHGVFASALPLVYYVGVRSGEILDYAYEKAGQRACSGSLGRVRQTAKASLLRCLIISVSVYAGAYMTPYLHSPWGGPP